MLADSIIKMIGSSRLPAYEVVAFLGLFVVAFLLLHGWWRNQIKSLWPNQLCAPVQN